MQSFSHGKFMPGLVAWLVARVSATAARAGTATVAAITARFYAAAGPIDTNIALTASAADASNAAGTTTATATAAVATHTPVLLATWH